MGNMRNTLSATHTECIPRKRLLKSVGLHIWIHAGAHPFKGSNESRVLAGRVSGQAVIVTHISWVDSKGEEPKIRPVERRKRCDGHAEVDPVVASVFRFSAKTFNGEVLGIISAVVPADRGLSCRIHGNGRLEVVMSAANLGLMVRVHLDGWAKIHPIFGAAEQDVRIEIRSRG